MPIKPRYKRRLFWTATGLVATGAIAIVVVPPMITLNSLKPKIQQTIFEQTGIQTDIRGDVHFSLLGHTTIVAHDIQTPMGRVGAAMFTIPFHNIFNIESANFTGDVSIYGANVKIDTLVPHNFGHRIDIYNSNIKYRNRDVEITRAYLDNGQLIGNIRTDGRKFSIDFTGDEFFIANQNENLEITGSILSNGGVRGRISVESDNINKLFNFATPHIDEKIDITANFEWDGGRDIALYDIVADTFDGNIHLYPNGTRTIQLNANDVEYDFSALTDPQNLYYNTNLNLDLRGKFKFGPRMFRHVKINALGTPDKVQISNIVADDIAITGGTIDALGAHDIMITMPYDGTNIMCLFSGTPQNWKCEKFTYGNAYGTLNVSGDKFTMNVTSPDPMPDINELHKSLSKIAPNGDVEFRFANVAGTMTISPRDIKTNYTFAQNQTLAWGHIDLPFLPEFMQTARGTLTWNADSVDFVPNTGTWAIRISGNTFYITGTDFKKWLPTIDLQSVRDMEYSISGNYSRGSISDLRIKIGDTEFTGTATARAITLTTGRLDIDAFANPEFIKNYPELEFLTMSPIMLPFDLPIDVSLRANSIIYHGNEYAHFVYARRGATQTFSITDDNRGSMLATISRKNSEYEIFAQLNNFVTHGKILSETMPLNIRDTVVTAELDMKTSGMIAHDIEYNMTGDIDILFDGGYLMGVGFDKFFASAPNITRINGEFALADALERGETIIKKMHVIGKYEHGNFITATPITLQMRHINGVGQCEITDNKMWAQLNLTLRGTSPEPMPLTLQIAPDGTRGYSLSEIMTNFDPDYMRSFIKTHSQF